MTIHTLNQPFDYRGFTIIKKASFYQIKDKPGIYIFLQDAKDWIDWWHDQQTKLKR